MATALDRYDRYTRRRKRHAARSGQRLDIQGLRMVAVLTVFACHLWEWPRGGFVGVDVFFVISGFLITGNLLRDAEKRGTVSFRHFYWNRVRRIVPAATLVLVLTYVAAVLVFMPFRAREVGIDALWAFVFLSNWWFAIEGTDYFTADASVSPLQHYWSLSIEEQFYFVWPALIFAISLVVLRKAWTHTHRMRIAGTVMAVVMAASLGWALYETATSATWAYFNTFARVWELGVGALLACSVGALARIPVAARPFLSWTGAALIAASIFAISEESAGFPAPWALLPVAGASAVIAAGVGTEPRYQAFLRNPFSGYVGDISYSLYLFHWPVIVVLGTLMDPGWHYSITVVALAFALAIASYHFVENPLRRADWGRARQLARDVRKRRYAPQQSSGYALAGAMTLLVVASIAYLMRTDAYEVTAPPPLPVAASASADPAAPQPVLGPLTSALQGEISSALQATEWPELSPTMEAVIAGPEAAPEVINCGGRTPPAWESCTWGSESAPTRIVLVGDSVAMAYAGPFRELALNSEEQVQVRVAAMYGCQFSSATLANADQSLTDACPARKQHTMEMITQTKPSVVVIANTYGEKVVDAGGRLTPKAWADTVGELIAQLPAGTRVVVLSAPPADVNIAECYGARSARPPDCVSRVTMQWRNIADAEQALAQSVGGVWLDSRAWFCSQGLCPSFVGTTPTKVDQVHMSPAYGQKIHQVIGEAMTEAGILR